MDSCVYRPRRCSREQTCPVTNTEPCQAGSAAQQATPGPARLGGEGQVGGIDLPVGQVGQYRPGAELADESPGATGCPNPPAVTVFGEQGGGVAAEVGGHVGQHRLGAHGENDVVGAAVGADECGDVPCVDAAPRGP